MKIRTTKGTHDIKIDEFNVFAETPVDEVTIVEFVAETSSVWGQEILDNFDDFIRKFWLVKPKAASLKKLLAHTHAEPQ